MSNRTDLMHHRTAIDAIDAGLRTIRARCPSLAGAVRISRAQGLLRAARTELAQALENPVDPVIEHPRVAKPSNNCAASA